MFDISWLDLIQHSTTWQQKFLEFVLSLLWLVYSVHRLALLIVQCPLDIQTLDKAAALPIAAATRVTDLRQYINSNLAYSNLKFLVLCTN